MNRLDAGDLRALHVSAAFLEPMLPALVAGIARELYSHPAARPYYTSVDQVQRQSQAWIRGLFGHEALDPLDEFLLRVARIHRRLGIPAEFFIEVCAMVGDHVTAAVEAQPLTEGVRARVIRTFNRVLFRQVQLYCASTEP